MNDTTPEMDARLDAMCARKSPAERLRMGCSMFDTSRELVTAGILRERPGISAGELGIATFRIFYGDDFSAETCERIVEHLRKYAETSNRAETMTAEIAR